MWEKEKSPSNWVKNKQTQPWTEKYRECLFIHRTQLEIPAVRMMQAKHKKPHTLYAMYDTYTFPSYR